MNGFLVKVIFISFLYINGNLKSIEKNNILNKYTQIVSSFKNVIEKPFYRGDNEAVVQYTLDSPYELLIDVALGKDPLTNINYVSSRFYFSSEQNIVKAFGLYHDTFNKDISSSKIFSNFSLEYLENRYKEKVVFSVTSPDNKLQCTLTENIFILSEIKDNEIFEDIVYMQPPKFNADDVTINSVSWLEKGDIILYCYGDLLEITDIPTVHMRDDIVNHHGEKLSGALIIDNKHYFIQSYGDYGIYSKRLPPDKYFESFPIFKEIGKHKLMVQNINYHLNNIANEIKSNGDNFLIYEYNPEKKIYKEFNIRRNDGNILSFHSRVNTGYSIHEENKKSFSYINLYFNFDSNGKLITMDDLFKVPEDKYKEILFKEMAVALKKEHDYSSLEESEFIDIVKKAFNKERFIVREKSIEIFLGVIMDSASGNETIEIPISLLEEIINPQYFILE